jgi:hypothetical protein
MVLVEGHGSIDGLYFSKERMVDGILGSDSILGYVGEYFHEQIDQILLIFELIKKAGKSIIIIGILRNGGEFLEELGIEGDLLAEDLVFFVGGGAEDVEDGEELVALGLALEQRVLGDQLGQDAASCPDVYRLVVLRYAAAVSKGLQDQLRCSVVAGNYVRSILSVHIDVFRRTEVANSHYIVVSIDENILWLQIPVDDVYGQFKVLLEWMYSRPLRI